MTAVLDLSEKELLELKELTKKTDASAALRMALVEYIRYAKRMRLKELSEQVEMQDNWRELENTEMDEQMASLVLIDTCVWVPFFSRKASQHKAAVAALLEEDRAALIGPILAEILLGFKRKEEADWVASALEGARYLELAWHDSRAAASLGRELIAAGHHLPLSDLYLATVAQRSSCLVYSIDPHFDAISNLERFTPT